MTESSLPLDRVMTRGAVTVSPGTTLAQAAETMLERGVGSLICVGGDGRVVGIVTDSDFVTRSVGVPFSTFRAPQLLGRWLGEDAVETIYAEARSRTVGDIMSSPVQTVEEDATVEDVLGVMLHRRLKHVPVVREGRPVGMVSRHDLLKLLLEHLRGPSSGDP